MAHRPRPGGKNFISNIRRYISCAVCWACPAPPVHRQRAWHQPMSSGRAARYEPYSSPGLYIDPRLKEQRVSSKHRPGLAMDNKSCPTRARVATSRKRRSIAALGGVRGRNEPLSGETVMPPARDGQLTVLQKHRCTVTEGTDQSYSRVLSPQQTTRSIRDPENNRGRTG